MGEDRDFTNPWQSAMSQSGWGFHTMRRGIHPGDHLFRPRCVEVEDVWNNVWSGDGTLSSICVVGSTKPSESAITTGGVGVSTLFGAVSTRGTIVFVPGVLKLQMY